MVALVLFKRVHRFAGTRVWMKEEPCARKERSIAPYGETAIPGCRYGHTVCAYGGNLYMYGGRNDEDGSFSSMECYDIGESDSLM